MRHWLRKYWKWTKHHFQEVLRLKKDPHEIALGFGVGSFIEVLPTFFGLNVLLGLLVTLVYPKVNKYSVWIALVIWNVVILAPLWTLSWTVGSWIYGPAPFPEIALDNVDFYAFLSRRFLTGNVIVAVLFGLVNYILVWWIATTYQRK